MKLEKSKWRKVKFGDVVFEDKKTVDARSSGLERYIAGEHMNTEDLHLRSWGVIGEDYLGPAFHRKFEKGDLLYGSRRTYLKKVAIADFDGITSNTTFVLKENKDLVVTGFIPFLMLSDRFTDHSVKHSKGSVNPYINFKDLAKFEFRLPPINQQEKLAELLWAGDDYKTNLNSLLTALMHAKQNYIENAFGITNKKYGEISLGKILKINHQTLSSKTNPEYLFKYLDISSILGPGKICELKTISFGSAPSRARRIVNKGDIVMSLVRPYFKCFVIVENSHDTIASTGTAVLTVPSEYSRDYIYYSLFHSRFGLMCNERMSGTNYPAITAKDVEEYSIPNKPLEDQIEISSTLKKFDLCIIQTEKIIENLKKQISSMTNSIV